MTSLAEKMRMPRTQCFANDLLHFRNKSLGYVAS